MSAHNIICYHTMVGYLTSTYSMFRGNGYSGTESHFGVGGIWGGDKSENLDGKIWQFQDLDHTADANLEGNPEVISIETADSAPKSSDNLPPWTDNQLDALVELTVWLCKKYNIPPTLIPDTRPGRRGLALHRQGVEHSDGIGSHPGWLVSGGRRWSTSRGKVCPGEPRSRQVVTVIIPRVQAILNGKEALIVDSTDEAKIEKILTNTLETYKFIPNIAPDATEATSLMTFRGFAQLSDQKADRANMKQDATDKKIDALTAQVAQMTQLLETLVVTPAPAKPSA
jgi:hypothetical protein